MSFVCGIFKDILQFVWDTDQDVLIKFISVRKFVGVCCAQVGVEFCYIIIKHLDFIELVIAYPREGFNFVV